MPKRDWGWLITRQELESWILLEDSDVLVVNKPAFVVCHPSKHGPWSSLVGACREYTGLDRLHMPSRLDRETSGVVVLAKGREFASDLQSAIQERRVEKTYHAFLCGVLDEPVVLELAIGKDDKSPVRVKRCVRDDGASAMTRFEPIAHGSGYTFARVQPFTGRLHQIRVHASHIGHAVVGDKLYGPDPLLMLEFREHGFSGRLPWMLPLDRHALHASRIVFQTESGVYDWSAPVSADLVRFAARTMPGITVAGK